MAPGDEGWHLGRRRAGPRRSSLAETLVPLRRGRRRDHEIHGPPPPELGDQVQHPGNVVVGVQGPGEEDPGRFPTHRRRRETIRVHAGRHHSCLRPNDPPVATIQFVDNRLGQGHHRRRPPGRPAFHPPEDPRLRRSGRHDAGGHLLVDVEGPDVPQPASGPSQEDGGSSEVAPGMSEGRPANHPGGPQHPTQPSQGSVPPVAPRPPDDPRSLEPGPNLHRLRTVRILLKGVQPDRNAAPSQPLDVGQDLGGANGAGDRVDRDVVDHRHASAGTGRRPRPRLRTPAHDTSIPTSAMTASQPARIASSP